MIRYATPDDFDVIKSLWKTERGNLSIPFTDTIMKPIEEKRMLVCEVPNDGVIAFCAFAIKKKNPSVFLKHLCVAEEYRHKGIGISLFKAILSIAPKNLPVVLTCRDGAENNTLYDKFAEYYLTEERETMTVRYYVLDRNKLGEYKHEN